MAANTTEETNELSTLEKESKMSLEEIFKACTKKGTVETSPDKSFGFNALDDDDDDGEDDGYNDHSFDEDEDEDEDDDEDEDENENEDNDNEEDDDDDDE